VILTGTVRTILLIVIVNTSNVTGEGLMKLNNPISLDYLKTNLRKDLPRLVLNEEREKHLREELATDPVVKNYYQAIKGNAERITREPLLTREMTGR